MLTSSHLFSWLSFIRGRLSHVKSQSCCIYMCEPSLAQSWSLASYIADRKNQLKTIWKISYENTFVPITFGATKHNTVSNRTEKKAKSTKHAVIINWILWVWRWIRKKSFHFKNATEGHTIYKGCHESAQTLILLSKLPCPKHVIPGNV